MIKTLHNMFSLWFLTGYNLWLQFCGYRKQEEIDRPLFVLLGFVWVLMHVSENKKSYFICFSISFYWSFAKHFPIQSTKMHSYLFKPRAASWIRVSTFHAVRTRKSSASAHSLHLKRIKHRPLNKNNKTIQMQFAKILLFRALASWAICLCKE